MRLIDADAFDKCLENAEAEAIHMRKYVFASAVNVIRGNLKAFPTIEPERERGRWIERNPQNSPDCRLIECSECGNAYIVGYNIDYDDWIDGRNFCMKCGADLRGGRNGKST